MTERSKVSPDLRVSLSQGREKGADVALFGVHDRYIDDVFEKNAPAGYEVMLDGMFIEQDVSLAEQQCGVDGGGAGHEGDEAEYPRDWMKTLTNEPGHGDGEGDEAGRSAGEEDPADEGGVGAVEVGGHLVCMAKPV